MRVTIIGPRTLDGEQRVEVEMPSVPRVGEYIEHAPANIQGEVRHIAYWWGNDCELEIQVAVRG